MQTNRIMPKGLDDNRCIDLTNQKFGFLTVIGISNARIENRVTWKCQCDCGEIKLLTSNNLKRGRYKSCGCKHRTPGINNPNWKGYGEISKTKWGVIRNGALSRNIPFSISIEEIWALFLKQNRKCALSGIDLSFSTLTRTSSGDGNASLDRIDSTKGYTIDNVQWIDKRLNWMKRDYSIKYFVDLCKSVSDYSKYK